MNKLPSVKIPTPFGDIHTQALETPPIRLPSMPDAHGKAALKQSVGADLIDLSDTVLDLIPGADIVGGVLDPVRDSITAMHEKEILGILTKKNMLIILTTIKSSRAALPWPVSCASKR